MIPRSIRGRLLLWFTSLFACVLGGFGFTAHRLYQMNEFRRIDDGLEARVAELQGDLRGGERPGGRRPRPPRHDFPPGPREFPEPPDRRPGERGRHDDRPPPFSQPGAFDPEGFDRLDFTLSDETAALFDESDPDSFYYAAWTGRGQLLAKSENARETLDMPPRSETGRSYTRQIGSFREIYYLTERGDVVLAGISIKDSVEAVRRLAWALAVAGAGVLLIAIGGGGFIIHRSFRPIRQISVTAKRIAVGDLSERVRVNDARSELGELAGVLNSTFARLEAAFSEQRNFTANASHELRTPLTVLYTETQRALSRERSAREYRETIELCRDATREMQKLTESLLELARLDVGQEAMQRTSFDLSEVARTAASMVQPMAREQRQQLTVETDPVTVVADQDRMRQVVINLLENAVRHTAPGGRIRLVTDIESNYAVLRVTDNGSGIAPEDLPHVFERFYRGDKARSNPEGHSGLGLAICKSIVEAHNGTIGVTSVKGQGTTFTVKIPR